MITEDFVSFETAKLLKEKGFDEPCQFLYFSKYKQEGDFVGNFNVRKNSEINEVSYSAPTLQMAMKWLREVHKIHIQLNFHPNIKDWGWYFMILVTGINGIEKCFRSYGPFETYSSYEEACEAAIRYCLENLI